jgi:ubiquinone/menaquinone biosynthesis C-methylase UbiE
MSLTLLEEIALAGPEHLDASYVASYDRKAGFDPTDDVEMLRARGLGPASTLVDLGAGTGTLAVAAAQICRRVVAVDVSTVMLAATRAKAEAHGLANVECVEAGFLTYRHRGTRPDVVYTRNALHHLPDFWKSLALARVAALLVPGGTLQLRDLVFSFDPVDAEDAVAHWLDVTAAETPDRGWTRPELETHLRDEHSTFTWLLEPMLERVGLAIVASDHSLGVYASYVCSKR